MKKVIIRTREGELTEDMWHFGCSCVNSFIKDLQAETYGKDWKDCAYSNNFFGAWVEINKNKTISVLVFSEVKR